MFFILRSISLSGAWGSGEPFSIINNTTTIAMRAINIRTITILFELFGAAGCAAGCICHGLG